MKRGILRSKFCLLAATALLFAACTQDELAEQDVALPQGAYPLTFTAVQTAPDDTPQTRVSENADGMGSKWTEGDRIKVTVSEKSNDMETTCTLDEKGKVTDYAPQLYWQNTNTATINAWYSNLTGKSTVTNNTVSLADQNKGLAYVLKADELTGKSCHSGNLTLTFRHQLAKIRVKLEKDDSFEGDLSDAALKVKGYTFCTVTDGEVSGGTNEGYITMHKAGDYYEANLVPGTIQPSETFEISAGEKTTKASLKEAVTLEKGKVYTITITVNAAGPEKITGGQTVDRPGNYILKGNITESVTLKGDNINLTLDGVTADIGNAIKVTGGNPTIIVKGANNRFNGNGAGILISPAASVTIQGATSNAADSKLTIKANSSNQPGIGCANESSCKNITIRNVTLDVTGGSQGVDGGAAIGTAGEWGSSVNDILIESSIVIATGGKGAAAIGFGTIIDPNYSINSIKIINSQIIAYVQYQKYLSSGYAAGIGFPYAAEISILTIKQPIEIVSTETNPAVYFANFKAMKDGTITTDAIRKVGKPMNTDSHSVFAWQGAKFNGETLGNDTGY